MRRSAGAVRRVLSSSPSPNESSHMLVDTFGRFHNYLRMSITEKCNFRCVYCMPLDGVTLTPNDSLMNLNERKRLISLFAAGGVDKIRFTGGEPTVNKSLPELIRHCRDIETIKSIGITTNGLVLKSQLDKLCDAGLTHVNISLDTLNPDRFASIVRRDKRGLAHVLSALYAAASRDLKVKVNCVLMRDVNYTEIADFVELTKDSPIDVRFIEVMPFDDNNWNPKALVPYFEAIDTLKEKGVDIRKDTSSVRDPHDTTKWYRVFSSVPAGSSMKGNESSDIGDSEGYMGRVGFITSMSSNFCGGCNRLRITADGKIKVCLFGSDELNILQAFRDGYCDADVVNMISGAVRAKHKALGGHNSPASIAVSKNRPMILIGG